MPTVDSGTHNATRTTCFIDPAGNLNVTFTYSRVSDGRPFHTRTITIPLTGAVVDQFGTVISASTPGALATALSAFLAQLDTTIATAASQGKLDL